jgi:high-affinity nickel-transport protein
LLLETRRAERPFDLLIFLTKAVRTERFKGHDLRSGRIFSDRSSDVRGKVIGICAFLISANIGAWIWAIIASHSHPVLLGTAVLAYDFGLRHVDNVTRKLMHNNERSAAVGLFLAVGHSLVLLLGVAIIVITEGSFESLFNNLNDEAGIIVGTIVSTAFLLAIAIMNLFIAAAVYKTFPPALPAGDPIK